MGSTACSAIRRGRRKKIKDKEFFASSFPDILAVSSAKDKAVVLQRIEATEPSLWAAYQRYVRVVHGEKHFMLDSGRYPLSAVGRLNLYRIFLEVSHTVTNAKGRVGVWCRRASRRTPFRRTTSARCMKPAVSQA